MLRILSNRAYRHLFLAQIIALIGTGLATVALGLLAYDLAGKNAGTVLGTALAIKMMAYVGIAPVATALTERLPRRIVLVCLDLIRAAVALLLPFVTQTWQIYILIFILQSASAAFTPTFQATIPDIIKDEDDYTKALSLSRLAYDLESVLSPLLAAALLTVISFHALFAGAVVGFIGSALLVVSIKLPTPKPEDRSDLFKRMTRGIRIYLSTERLRGLLAINLAVAAASAMVIVNTVVLVQGQFGLTTRHTALALAVFGAGSMIAALALPSVLQKVSNRSAMLTGSILLLAGLALGPIHQHFYWLLILWAIIGFGYSLAQTPTGHLLRRSSNEADRPALFAAQFALSHGCWLITYPAAGWIGAEFGLNAAYIVLAIITTVAVTFASLLWKGDHEE